MDGGEAGEHGRNDGTATIGLEQRSNYPWEGDVRLGVSMGRPTAFRMLLRIPGWARGEAMPGGLYGFADRSAEKVVIKVNGQIVDAPMHEGYAVVERTWKKGDSVELVLPMIVRRVEACDSVKEDLGKVALQRGPLLYCAEWTDNGGKTSNFIMPANDGYFMRGEPGLLGGVVTIGAAGERVVVSPDGLGVSTKNSPVMLIPYYAWANRGKGEMNIWFPARVREVELVSKK
jgi:hypothetical protein